MSSRPSVLSVAPLSNAITHSGTRPRWATAACIVAADALAVSLLFGLAVVARHSLTHTYALTSYFDMAPYVVLLLAAFWLHGLYPGALLHPAEEIRRTFAAITLVFLVAACTSFLWRNVEAYSRAVFLVTWVAGGPVVLATRQIVRAFFAKRSWWGVSAVILGSGPSAQRIIRGTRVVRRGVRIVGVFADGAAHSWPNDLPPVLGDLSDAPAIAASGVARYAIVAVPTRSNLELNRFIQDYCNGFSHVLLIPDLPGLCSLDVSVREVGGQVGFELPQRLCQRGAAIAKRSVDLLVSGLALFVLSPLFLLITIIIKAGSPREPVFFAHLREGRGGRTFKALKFRTMVPGASRILTDYLAEHPEENFEWQRDHKLKNDPRVTSIGKWLRKFSLDELPQLLNVLAGDMSLVGPRPIVQSEVSKYGRGFELYSRVRPGITGLWQISGRNNTTYEARVAFDEYYVRNWSIWIDAYILTRTLKVVFTADGAY
jgi:Undecaprenyl-phosphate galactose phosphotransferase WbaP